MYLCHVVYKILLAIKLKCVVYKYSISLGSEIYKNEFAIKFFKEVEVSTLPIFYATKLK